MPRQYGRWHLTAMFFNHPSFPFKDSSQAAQIARDLPRAKMTLDETSGNEPDLECFRNPDPKIPVLLVDEALIKSANGFQSGPANRHSGT